MVYVLVCQAKLHTNQEEMLEIYLELFPNFLKQDIAKDSEGQLVFLAETAWVLQTAQKNFPKIRFSFTSEG